MKIEKEQFQNSYGIQTLQNQLETIINYHFTQLDDQTDYKPVKDFLIYYFKKLYPETPQSNNLKYFKISNILNTLYRYMNNQTLQNRQILHQILYKGIFNLVFTSIKNYLIFQQQNDFYNEFFIQGAKSNSFENLQEVKIYGSQLPYFLDEKQAKQIVILSFIVQELKRLGFQIDFDQICFDQNENKKIENEIEFSLKIEKIKQKILEIYYNEVLMIKNGIKSLKEMFLIQNDQNQQNNLKWINLAQKQELELTVFQQFQILLQSSFLIGFHQQLEILWDEQKNLIFTYGIVSDVKQIIKIFENSFSPLKFVEAQLTPLMSSTPTYHIYVSDLYQKVEVQWNNINKLVFQRIVQQQFSAIMFQLININSMCYQLRLLLKQNKQDRNQDVQHNFMQNDRLQFVKQKTICKLLNIQSKFNIALFNLYEQFQQIKFISYTQFEIEIAKLLGEVFSSIGLTKIDVYEQLTNFQKIIQILQDLQPKIEELNKNGRFQIEINVKIQQVLQLVQLI